MAFAQKKTKSVGIKYLDANTATYSDIASKIHHYAELGYKEYKSSAFLQQHLRDNGFTVESGVDSIPTAFVATYGKGKPVIGFMAEFDALPGMSQDTVPYLKACDGEKNGHACGHNLLGTGSVAAAVAVAKYLSEGHPGTIKLFGCPAEEGGGGKAYLVRDGIFNGVDAVLDWHPSSDNGVSVETGLANVHIYFRFHGIASHASMSPEKGRSALDGVESFNYMMNMMREHVPMTSRIHYIITNGGKSANIVPDFAEVEYFFRSPKRDIVEEIKQRAIKAAEGAAMGTGTTMTYEIMSGNYERLFNQHLSQVLQRNLELVGGPKLNNREKDFALKMMENSGVKDLSLINKMKEVEPLQPEHETLTGASSDVGNVSWVVPVGSFGIATYPPSGGGHCWQQTAAGGMSIGFKGMMCSAKVLYLTAYDLLNDPKLLREVTDEFDARRGKDFHFIPLMGNRKPPLHYRD